MTVKKIDILMSEMSAVRSAIDGHNSTIHSLKNFMFVLTGAEISLFVAIASNSVDFNNFAIRILILMIPILFMCLAIHHTACIIRIHRDYKYLNYDLYDKLSELAETAVYEGSNITESKSVLQLLRKVPLDAKLSYLSNLIIKLISTSLGCVFYICLIVEHSIQPSVIEYIVFLFNILCICSLVVLQHD